MSLESNNKIILVHFKDCKLLLLKSYLGVTDLSFNKNSGNLSIANSELYK